MRLVVQRVSQASVTVDGRMVASCDVGLLVLVGFENGDTQAQLPWAASKLAELRIFADDVGKMNLSVAQAQGSIILVPNFTLAGDCIKGRRPSFDRALAPELARAWFDQLAELVRQHNVPVSTGVFAAHMHVTLTNDGPITLVIDVPPLT
jgi:D-aminoacyl-tRNA deacylase